jgi:hypothetical protein
MFVIYCLFYSVELDLGSFCCYTLYVKYQNCHFVRKQDSRCHLCSNCGGGRLHVTLSKIMMVYIGISLTKVLDFGHCHSYWVYCSRVFSQVEEWEKDPNLLGLFERTTYAFSKSFKWAVILEFIPPFPLNFSPPPWR